VTDRPVHVTPTWEQHADSSDCWCEPSVSEGGALVVHHAKKCKPPFGAHHWVWRTDPDKTFVERMECLHCGQPRKHVAQGYGRHRD
jgi:hypothetical protein